MNPFTQLMEERAARKRQQVADYRVNSGKKAAMEKCYREANKAKIANYHSEWARANVGLVNANKAKYELAKIQRVPSWADIEKIKAIYQEAERTGMTVDHIIPLRGQLVSGLHVENNLQLLPGSVNYSKGNTFKVE